MWCIDISVDFIQTSVRYKAFAFKKAFMRGIHRWLVNSPNKVPVTRKMFPFDDVHKSKD